MPAIHPVVVSGMKFGIAVLPAKAGQLSVAVAIRPAMRLRDLVRDLAFVMRFIGVSSVGGCATHFSRAFYRKQSGRRHGAEHAHAARRMLAIVALRYKSWSTKTLRQARARRVGRVRSTVPTGPAVGTRSLS